MSVAGQAHSNSLAEALRLSRRHLFALLLPMYILALLDRVNIGFAKQAYQASTGVSDAAYAFGAGLFFLTYAALEIPSNLILHRVGARVWMARIMITWGLASAAMIFSRGPLSFYLLRGLLGAAEAGFFPGVILYLTYWFPEAYIGQMIGLFYFGAPLAFILGGPLSGLLLEMHGVGGLQGWQWMFLVEGSLASAVGVLVLLLLRDSPATAPWLAEPEREALTRELARESREKGFHDFRAVLFSPRLMLLSAIYFLIQFSVYGVIFYLPTQVAALSGRKIGFVVGLLSAIPWICALVATFLLPRFADRTNCHRAAAGAALAVSAVSIALSGSRHSIVSMVALCVAASSFMAVQPIFWRFPVIYLGGAAAAGGIAVINALGTLGGFVAPNIKNFADVAAGSSNGGLYALATGALLGSVCILQLKGVEGLVGTHAPTASRTVDERLS